MKALTCATRGRSDGDWHESEHRQRLEVGGQISNSITSVAKDSLVLIYEERNDKIKTDERRGHK